MKYVEGAQRRREPSSRKQSSTFYIIEVTQVGRNPPRDAVFRRIITRDGVSTADFAWWSQR